MSTAATLIRNARREARLTQAELANRMSTTQSAVARLERPGSNPRISTLEAALEAAGRGLELGAGPVGAVDVTQLHERLRLTPAERLAAFQRSQRNLARLVRRARRA